MSHLLKVTAWRTFTPTLDGSTTNPTKGTTAVDNGQWRRVGKNMELMWNYRQTGAGSAGSGDYLMLIPGGYTIDTNILPASTVILEAVCGSCSCASTSGEGNTPQRFGYVKAYDSTHIAFALDDLATSISACKRYWGSDLFTLSGATVNFSMWASIPISEWS